MKFSIEKESLVKTLNKIAHLYTANDSDIDVLDCLYISAEKNILTLKSTNLKVESISKLKIESVVNGVVVINFKTFYGIVKNISSAKLTFQIENNQLLIKASNKRFAVNIYPPDNYPDISIKNNEKLSIDKEKFLKALSKFDKIFGKDFPLNHLCLISDSNHVEFVATNGRRLSYCKFENSLEKSFKILIDDKSLSILKTFLRSGDNFQFEIGDKELIVFDESIKMVIRYNSEFKFPNYQYLLGLNYTGKALINKKELEEALKLLTLNSKNEKLIFSNIENGELTLSYKSIELECEQIINIENDKDVLLRLSADHLLDTIKNINEDKIQLSFNDKVTPIRISSEGYIAFVTLCNQ